MHPERVCIGWGCKKTTAGEPAVATKSTAQTQWDKVWPGYALDAF